MSSKKKLTISLSVAAAVLVAVIIAIVAVFAAAKQTVESNINVKFRAKNVDCTIIGSQKTNTDESATNFKTATIKSTEPEGTEYDLNPTNDIVLTIDKDGNAYVDLTYTITNTSHADLLVKITSISSDTADFTVTVVDENETLTGAGYTIGAMVGQTAKSKSFTIRVEATAAAKASATDATMKVSMVWDLSAVYSTTTNAQ